MSDNPTPSAVGRRPLLKVLGSIGAVSGLATVASADDHDGYVLIQGGECVPFTPLSGDLTVEQLYDYALDETRYSSRGTVELQRPDTSILFLYDGPEGLSLVIVHGELGGPGDGGSASFEVSGLPADGEWVVEDDNYDGESNYDIWNHSETRSGIDWTWDEARTDGGAFRGLAGDAIAIDPAFNDEAGLHGEYYTGTVDEWQLLSGELSNPHRVSLALDEPVTIERGACAPTEEGQPAPVSGETDGDDRSGDTDDTGTGEEDDGGQRRGSDGREGDRDRGHGNDADGHDEDNPGRGPPGNRGGGRGDRDRGHGNDADGHDEDNPGRGSIRGQRAGRGG